MSRVNLLYAMNARVSMRLKVVAERLCYQPLITKRLVTGSKGAAQELNHYFPKLSLCTSVVPLGVDAAVFPRETDVRVSIRSSLGILGNELLALFVGGDWERKGLQFAVEAVSRVPGTRLAVIGPGDADRYRRMAVAHGCAARVSFVGVQKQIGRYYAAADAFLLPTAYETYSLATHEAATAGLPLLVTRVNGVEEILTDGVNGWFISREAEQISARLATLRDDPDLRSKMGQRSRSAVSLRTWSRMVDSYISLYGDLNSKRTTLGNPC